MDVPESLRFSKEREITAEAGRVQESEAALEPPWAGVVIGGEAPVGGEFAGEDGAFARAGYLSAVVGEQEQEWSVGKS